MTALKARVYDKYIVRASLSLPEIKWSYPTDKELLNEIHSEYELEKLLNPTTSSYPTKDDYLNFLKGLKEVSKTERLDPKALKGKHIWKDYDDLVKTVKSFGLPKDPDSMLNAIKEGIPLPMPIVVKKANGEMTLLGGATRSGIALLSGQHIVAVVIDEKKAQLRLADKLEEHADDLAKEDKRKDAYQKMKDYYLQQKEKPAFPSKEEQFSAYLAEHLYRKVAELRGLPEREWVVKKLR